MLKDITALLPKEYRDAQLIRDLLTPVDTVDARQRSRAEEIARQIMLDQLTINLAVEEKLAGITPAPGATLDDRRAAVIAKWRSGGKTDLAQIQRVCDAWKNGEVEVSYQGDTIHLQFVGAYGVPADMDGLLAAVGDVRPAHLAVEYALRYLLLRDVRAMTVATLQQQPITNFAFRRDDG